MSIGPSKGIAALLAAIPITGVFGADKYYVGATKFGIIQTILAITIIGLIVSVPWSTVSAIVLVISILAGGIPFLYPSVAWAPTTSTDITIGWILAGLFILSSIVGIIRMLFPAKKDKNKNKNNISN